MKLLLQRPARAMAAAWRVKPPTRDEFDRFSQKTGELLELARAAEAKKESEEHLKNLLRDFLRGTAFGNFYCNTSGRQDLAIHLGPAVGDPVGVIIEAKRRGSREMPTPAAPNARALHELLLYYLRERDGGNARLQFLVATDLHDWFVFDAHEWERLVFSNKKLLGSYREWASGQLSADRTAFFYDEIARPFFEKECPELTAAHLRLDDFETADEAGRIDFFKFLHPAHLLRRPFDNDSNALNKPFYDELLHILGLEEVKSDGKKLIQRAVRNRADGSLLENALNKLEVSGRWRKAPGLASMGATDDERKFSIALELVIAWLNRLLFLKLLEGQLRRWRPDWPHARFLHGELLRDFDNVSTLFFEVLNQRPEDRRAAVRQKFGELPYLNSSLFELTPLEDAVFSIESLDDDAEMPLHPGSVLKKGQRPYPTERPRTLQYLLDFLEAFDFSSEPRAAVQAENRDLINASVLGLIFEKLNGYRDGSFFTPGFVTMFMCRETLRRAVVQKFNDRHGWDCRDLADLHNRLDPGRLADHNALFNELKICDPAVGSGHFLVSALNELLAIKSELGILAGRDGRRLRDWRAEVGNDQLLVIDAGSDRPFEYRPGVAEAQRVQEALFFEKQTLIENCLFGADINPKSAMICRLRLWIELLKSAFFLDSGRSAALETLPNIDINIKTGNSLVGRFALDEDLSEVFRKNKTRPADYLAAVRSYKQTRDRAAKAEVSQFIERLKGELRQTVFNRNPIVKKLSEARGKRQALEVVDLFGGQKLAGPDLQTARARLDADLARLETELAEYRDSPLFHNALEWRFEFPEVLDGEGEFVGFDVVVGNPPYIRQEELKAFKDHFSKNYKTYAGTADLYVYFVERGMGLLRDGGQFSYILPNKWMRAGYGLALRRWLTDPNRRLVAITDFGDLPVFDEATTYPCIIELEKKPAGASLRAFAVPNLDTPEKLGELVETGGFSVNIGGLQDSGWTLADESEQALLDKIRAAGRPLGEVVGGKIFYGIKTGFNEAFVIDEKKRAELVAEDPKSEKVIKPFLTGREIKRYRTPVSDKFFILFEKGISNKNRSEKTAEQWLESTYPALYRHLSPFAEKAKKRADQGDHWWEMRACDYYGEFEKEKIQLAEIALQNQFSIDSDGQFCDTTAFIIQSNQSRWRLYSTQKLSSISFPR